MNGTELTTWEVVIVLGVIALWVVFVSFSTKLDDWTFKGK